MEGACHTLRQRLKDKLAPAGGGLEARTLPVISTLHALAFRLLSDRNHAGLLGLESGAIALVDEATQQAVLTQVASDTFEKLQSAGHQASYNSWVSMVKKSIVQAKNLHLSPQVLLNEGEATGSYKMKQLGLAYQGYNQQLALRGVLDFTDLIWLAIELLEKHPTVREYYQQLFSVIIEDEAQDSSALLQRLLALLTTETSGLVRIGDTNQSITTSFSAADPAVFRAFMAEAMQCVQMQQSHRCALPIMSLANRWQTACLTDASGALTNAFINTPMHPVEGANPTLLSPIEAHSFESPLQEEQALVQQVKAWQTQFPQASQAVLVRNNTQVATLVATLNEAGIAAVGATEQVGNLPVLMVCLAFLKLLNSPTHAPARLEWFETLIDAELPVIPALDEEAVEQLRLYLSVTPLFALPPQEIPEQWPFLHQLYGDFHDFNRQLTPAHLPSLLVRVVDSYFESVIDKAVGYSLALLVKQALYRSGGALLLAAGLPGQLQTPLGQWSALTVAIQALEEAHKNPKLLQSLTNPMAFLSANEQTVLANNQAASSVVQVMTLHKSKGQEFDLVLMPSLTQRYFPARLSQVSLREADKAMVRLAVLGKQQNGAIASDVTVDEAYATEEKAFQHLRLEEEARLLYVGVTRAKRGLWLSWHKQHTDVKPWQKAGQSTVKTDEPSALLQIVTESLLT
jgi:superfamily I DNA/RNA helicase